MKFERFESEVYQTVKERLGDRYKVVIQKVTKNNGCVKTGLSIKDQEETIVPVIYLEPYYEEFAEGMTWDEVIEDILTALEDHGRPDIKPADFLVFDKVKNKVACKLINTEKNKELLEQIPHINWMDLSAVFYILLEGMENGQLAALIHNNHMEVWGTSAEELFSLSKENMKRLLPVQIQCMARVIGEILQNKWNLDLGDEELSKITENENPMFVITNSSGITGACHMMPGMGIELLADQLGRNLVIMPSSIHESIAVPYEEGMDLKGMALMVQEINRTEVVEEERLSDRIYYYDRNMGAVFMVDDNGKILYNSCNGIPKDSCGKPS